MLDRPYPAFPTVSFEGAGGGRSGKKFTLAVSLSAGNLRGQERAVLALVAEGTAEDILWLVLCRLSAVNIVSSADTSVVRC